jgi:hypothetical protein
MPKLDLIINIMRIGEAGNQVILKDKPKKKKKKKR